MERICECKETSVKRRCDCEETSMKRRRDCEETSRKRRHDREETSRKRRRFHHSHTDQRKNVQNKSYDTRKSQDTYSNSSQLCRYQSNLGVCRDEDVIWKGDCTSGHRNAQSAGQNGSQFQSNDCDYSGRRSYPHGSKEHEFKTNTSSYHFQRELDNSCEQNSVSLFRKRMSAKHSIKIRKHDSIHRGERYVGRHSRLANRLQQVGRMSKNRGRQVSEDHASAIVQQGVSRVLPTRKVKGTAKCTERNTRVQKPSCAEAVIGDRKTSGKREIRRMGFRRLSELCEKDYSEILLNLCLPDNGFTLLLESVPETNRELIALILIALGKACRSSHRSNVMSLLSDVTERKQFLFMSLLKYLAGFQNRKNEKIHLDSLHRLIDFLECFQQCSPASASEILSVIMPLLKLTCQKAFAAEQNDLLDVEKKLNEMDMNNNHYIHIHLDKEVENISRTERDNIKQPPENYRDIPVLPTQEDISIFTPFLRQIVVNGKYFNKEHYLDVQFRLLREDYIRPLREGINRYIGQKNNEIPAARNHDVRIYEHVHIVKQEFFRGMLIHVAFLDMTDLSKVSWEYSKRLLSGSLLCLSSDGFQTMWFASVARRDCAKLKQGYLLLRFEELADEMLNIDPLKEFVVVETSAYFEAYRHNLSALHNMGTDEFPLQNYIVDVQKDASSPKYLKPSTTFDMQPLFFPLSNTKSENDLQGSEKHVELLNFDKWPTEGELGLDKSQYEALKCAVTKEFAVIQGPPGTGKTYIGLRIIQLLLHNFSKWQPSHAKSSPILVVCYTNHALDQFLEGVLMFNSNLIRVGGRCSNDVLSSHRLINLRETLRHKRQVPHHIFSNMRHLDHFIRDRQEMIKSARKEIEKSFYDIVSENMLKSHMKEEHFRSIKSAGKTTSVNHNYCDNVLECESYSDDEYMIPESVEDLGEDYMIYDWLGIRLQGIDEKEVDCEDEGSFKKESASCKTDVSHALTEQLSFSLTKECGQSICALDVGDETNDVASSVSLGRAMEVTAVSGNLLQSGCENSKYVNIANEKACGNSAVHKKKLNFQKIAEVGNELEEGEVKSDIDDIEAMRIIDAEDFSDFVDVTDSNRILSDRFDFHFGNELKTQGRSKWEQQIIGHIHRSIPMTDTEADNVTSLYKLPISERWRLYKYWVGEFKKAKDEECLKIQQELHKDLQKLEEMKVEEDLYILRKAQVVGMTTTGAAKYRKLVQSLNPRIIIVEEAAEILESHVVTSLSEGTQHLILIGDHQQLRPSPNVYELAVKYNLNVSLFERMVKNGMDYCQLKIQHRMRPCISSLIVPSIYPNLYDDKSVQEFENIRGVAKNMFFVSHSVTEGQVFDSSSRVNQHEAKFIVRLCKHLILQGYSSSQITILTAYSGQLFALKRLMTNELFSGVRVTVVDNFQGEENDIILISFVRSNVDGAIGFLKISNRVCVALSRAKKGLFCVGNFNLLAENSELWKKIMVALKKQGSIGPSLRLACQNHPNIYTDVSEAKDFDKVPEGGCTLLCEYRLLCGHTCSRVCHAYDMEHSNVQCNKICDKELCPFGHKCKKKCFQKCGPCIVKVEKLLPSCDHRVMVPCHVHVEEFLCPLPCCKLLTCGHRCRSKCSEDCTQQCNEQVSLNLPCGHKMMVECCKRKLGYELIGMCKENCRVQLECGHMCRGNCGRCSQGRLHLSCKSPCRRILVCGHECSAPCSKSCPPCKTKCENRCVHSICPKVCGRPCGKCKEPCDWRCEHKACDMKCGEICNRDPCDEPCKKKLACGHPCIGLCGEPCPDKCAACHPEVKDIFFGTESEEDARFIQLEDCKHILEVEGLTYWMNKENDGEIQMKVCPKCKTVIRKNLRFGNVVKSCLNDIEKVKEKVFGDQRKNEEMKNTLITKVRDLMFNNERLLKPLLKFLERKEGISLTDIVRCENIVNIAENYISLQTDLASNKYFKSVSVSSGLQDSFEKLVAFSEHTIQLILGFITKEYLTADQQQLHDVIWEVKRLGLLRKFLVFCKGNWGQSHERFGFLGIRQSPVNLSNENQVICLGIMDCLCKLGPFREGEEQIFSRSLEKLKFSLTGADLNVTETEKKLILKAMNLSQGHWYQCPNGHVYCIADCGGAVVESTCNECGAKIGGRNHALHESNRVATAMDGAVHPAWSQANNMGNYNFGD